MGFMYRWRRKEMDENVVEWAAFASPLRGHHPKCIIQVMLFEYIRDNSTHIFFIQLLSADIHNFGLSTNKPDKRTLVIKIYNLNKIVQPVTVKTASCGNYNRIS